MEVRKSMIPTDGMVFRLLDGLVRVTARVLYAVLLVFAVGAFAFLSWGAWNSGGWAGLSVYWGTILAMGLYAYSESRK